MADAKSQEKQAQTETIESDDFASLLQQEFKPKSDRAKEEVESAVHTLAQQVLEGEALLADDVIGTINAIIAEIDAKLTEQINHLSLEGGRHFSIQVPRLGLGPGGKKHARLRRGGIPQPGRGLLWNHPGTHPGHAGAPGTTWPG